MIQILEKEFKGRYKGKKVERKKCLGRHFHQELGSMTRLRENEFQKREKPPCHALKHLRIVRDEEEMMRKEEEKLMEEEMMRKEEEMKVRLARKHAK